jgi:UrcA family protein
MKISTRYAVSLVGLLLAGPVALGASPGDEVASRTVRFKDLDLSTAAGAQTLYERISSAARAVCLASAPMKSMLECRTRAIDEAVRGVGSPLLSSIHRSTAERVEEVVLR